MKTCIIAVLAILGAGCKSELKKNYERTAREINPVFLELKPAAQIFRAAIAKGAARDAIDACYTMDNALLRLGAIDLIFDKLAASTTEITVSTQASSFRGTRDNLCEDFHRCDHGDCTTPKWAGSPDGILSLNGNWLRARGRAGPC
jgi:hypothetical protein